MALENDTSLAAENSFILQINRMGGVSYDCQSPVIPGTAIAINTLTGTTVDAPRPGSKIVYNPFTCRFLVDEDYNNWKEIHEWQQEILTADDPVASLSDFSLVIPNSHGNNGISLRFTNTWPLSIDDIDLTSLSDGVITCGLTMLYETYVIENA